MTSFPIKEGYKTVRHLGSAILKLYKWLMYSILVVKIEVIVIEKLTCVYKDTWIISMWPFNQYRVLKIKVTSYIYHKASDVHIFHIINGKIQDEKRSRCQSELYKGHHAIIETRLAFIITIETIAHLDTFPPKGLLL